MSDEKLVYLAFSSPKVQPDTITLGSCATCRNKTFTLLHDSEERAPMLRCAACGTHLGRMGWASEEPT